MAAAVSIAVSITLLSYLCTVFTSSSFCLGNVSIVNADAKILNALAYVDDFESRHPSSPYVRFPGKACCKVDKGNFEVPRLTVSDLLLRDIAHYVHVPQRAKMKTANGNMKTRDLLIPVSSCGKPISYGVSL